jgi:hypothetical protein
MDYMTHAEHTALNQNQQPLPEAVQAALMEGDIAKLKPQQRVMYYRSVCQSLGLNYLTRPFDLIRDESGKHQLYARKEATEQLRKLHRVSTKVISRERLDDLYIVTVQSSTPDGRFEEAQGIVYIGQAKGNALANALMKAETKAKRRATLDICGLGWMLVEGDARGQQMQFDPARGSLPEDAEVQEEDTGDVEDVAAAMAAEMKNGLTPDQQRGIDALSAWADKLGISLGELVRYYNNAYGAVYQLIGEMPAEAMRNLCIEIKADPAGFRQALKDQPLQPLHVEQQAGQPLDQPAETAQTEQGEML